MLESGINIVADFELEEYYPIKLFEIPVNSSIEVISAYHFDNSNDIYLLRRVNEKEVRVTKYLL